MTTRDEIEAMTPDERAAFHAAAGARAVPPWDARVLGKATSIEVEIYDDDGEESVRIDCGNDDVAYLPAGHADLKPVLERIRQIMGL